MKRFYTAEAVTEGHPDKVCDQIADAILDECLRNDETSKVACEVLATKGNIFVAVEITSRHEPDVFGVIQNVMEGIGYACKETPQLMPMPVVLANRIVRELSACRKSSYIQGILPDGKAQVTVEYEDGKPVRLVWWCPASIQKKRIFGSWRQRSERKCCSRHCVRCHRMKRPGFISIRQDVLSVADWKLTPD